MDLLVTGFTGDAFSIRKKHVWMDNSMEDHVLEQHKQMISEVHASTDSLWLQRIIRSNRIK